LRARAPQWVVLVWLWTALPISILCFYECHGTTLERACHVFANEFGGFWVLTATFTELAPQNAPIWAQLLFPLTFTVLADLLTRRWVPARVPAWTLLVGLVAWTIVGLFSFIGFLFVPRYQLGLWPH
jgi:hypothetical protein